MKALVLREYNRLVLEELPEPVPGPGEVLVRVRACGICGSDVHGLDGSTGRRVPPLVMGHEAAGEIAALGTGVAGLEVGRRVTFDSTIYCGRCAFCRAGEINLCDHRQVLGVSCEEYRRDGAFAEYVAVPSRSIYPLPEGLSFERAALVEPLSVAVHAVDRLAPREGERAVVLGAGVIGLLALQVLKARGCGRVIAVDLDRGRLELARELGADQTFAPEKGTDVAAELVRLSGGAGLDLAVEAVGLPATVETAVNCLRKGGTGGAGGQFFSQGGAAVAADCRAGAVAAGLLRLGRGVPGVPAADRRGKNPGGPPDFGHRSLERGRSLVRPPLSRRAGTAQGLPAAVRPARFSPVNLCR